MGPVSEGEETREARTAVVRQWRRVYESETLVSPVLPEEAANLAVSRRRRRGRPRHPSVHWSEDLVTEFAMSMAKPHERPSRP